MTCRPWFLQQLTLPGAFTMTMEQVTEYVKERILALRAEHPGQYSNISCLRTNAQKYLPYYFHKGQLTKLFFLFPVSTATLPPHPTD